MGIRTFGGSGDRMMTMKEMFFKIENDLDEILMLIWSYALLFIVISSVGLVFIGVAEAQCC